VHVYMRPPTQNGFNQTRKATMSDDKSFSGRNPIVVVAEDSPTQAFNLRDLLRQSGIEVLWAPNGVECLRLVDQVRPDLIILDLEMPEMNGLETCAALKKNPNTENIPVIMFTRHDNPELIRLGLEHGAVDYIPKDAFAHAVLLETLRDIGLIGPRSAPVEDET
jgi:putative two-component system response regulator